MESKFMLTRKEFWKKVWRLAFKKGVDVTIAVGAVLAILLPFASWFDPYRTLPDHEKFWSIFDKYAFGWISIAIFWFFVIKHFLQASYLVYEAEVGPLDTRILRMETELSELRSRRPEFRFEWNRINLQTSFYLHPSGTNVAQLSGTLAFENAGDGIAVNSTFSAYFCWLQNPSRIELLGGLPVVSRTPRSAHIVQPFSVFEPARWLPTAQPPQWWFNNEGLIIRIEISTHANAPDGPICSHMESYFWSPYDPTRLTFPRTELLAEADTHIERFKSRRSTTLPLRDRDTGEPLTREA